MSAVQHLIKELTEANSYMKFECLLLLMASTVSFHFDSFIAKIDAIFPFLVAWKRARKVDESLERDLYFGAFFRGYHSVGVRAWWRHLTFLVSWRERGLRALNVGRI